MKIFYYLSLFFCLVFASATILSGCSSTPVSEATLNQNLLALQNNENTAVTDIASKNYASAVSAIKSNQKIIKALNSQVSQNANIAVASQNKVKSIKKGFIYRLGFTEVLIGSIILGLICLYALGVYLSSTAWVTKLALKYK